MKSRATHQIQHKLNCNHSSISPTRSNTLSLIKIINNKQNKNYFKKTPKGPRVNCFAPFSLLSLSFISSSSSFLTKKQQPPHKKKTTTTTTTLTTTKTISRFLDFLYLIRYQKQQNKTWVDPHVVRKNTPTKVLGLKKKMSVLLTTSKFMAKAVGDPSPKLLVCVCVCLYIYIDTNIYIAIHSFASFSFKFFLSCIYICITFLFLLVQVC